jgi:hypothetical protein
MSETSAYVNSYDHDAPVPTVGSRWIWERGNETAEETIKVTDVKWNGEEWFVATVAGPRPPRELNNTVPGRPYWNDLSRFWEAVSPLPAGVS